MYKQILAHKQYIEGQLKQPLGDEARKSLLKYHVKRVRDFQHERLIHLLVTFFFSFLFLSSCVALMSLASMLLFWPLTALMLILCILEIAYIRHYYQLENGVQSLYELTEKLGKKSINTERAKRLERESFPFP